MRTSSQLPDFLSQYPYIKQQNMNIYIYFVSL